MTDYGKMLKHATNQMNRAMDQYARQFGVTGVQMSILDYLGSHGNVLQHDIEVEFAIQRSTMTVTLQRMEKAGLIYRTESAKDARQKTVNMSAKAQPIQNRASAYIQGQQQAMQQKFSSAELRQFEQVLEYFIKLNGSEN
ncbi:MarR family winged helix-turn-helix transcriptional regulator [Secundilactobacillus folii]|uniref:MarR family transcriptional regulator n=1 Tax=Secundilactobacillus folii TaxID=2678357 RepID=A0A7X2XWS4_9LACO|nr:MarR family transcriptional regulator [Secundilactobacillus folii]MTV83092.1 MarR family transcriptional regulator [Secundilactobacillus folii]